MDAVTGILGLPAMLGAVFESAIGTQGTKAGSVSYLVTLRLCFLKVLEIPVSGGEGTCIAKTTSQAEISDFLEALPPIPDGTIRIYVEEAPGKANILSAHFRSVVGTPDSGLDYESRFAETATVGENIHALVTQWESSSRWLRTKHFDPFDMRERVSNIGGLRGGALNFGGPFSLGGAIETTMAVRSICLDRQRTIILISATSIIRDRKGSQGDVNRVTSALDMCSDFLLGSQFMFKPGRDAVESQTAHIQLIMLQFLHFHLMQVDAFLTYIDINYATERYELLDPHRISFTTSVLKELTSWTSFCDYLRNLSLATTDLVSHAIDIIEESIEEDIIARQAFRSKRAEIRAECSALAKLSSSMVERFESRLKFFELFRNVQGSGSIWLLTLLAFIFLPLSLASSVLSMQTRFAELHFLLYDFCGVLMIIGSLTVLIFLGLKLTVVIIDQLTKLKVTNSRVLRMMNLMYLPAATVIALLVFSLWALIFTSFIVGMIKDVSLGLKILGYGCAAYLGIFLLSCGVAASMYHSS